MSTAAGPTSKQFQIRMVGGKGLSNSLKPGMGVSIGLAVDVIYFEIRSPATRTKATYLYQAWGAGLGLKIPLTATLEGPWNDFRTTVDLSVADFAGQAKFSSMGTFGLTKNTLMCISGKAARAIPFTELLDFKTGETIGAGMTGTMGDMKLFSGPVRY